MQTKISNFFIVKYWLLKDYFYLVGNIKKMYKTQASYRLPNEI